MEPLYTLNTTATASEEFDGETIVIQFRKGTYSTLTGSGPVILALLAQPVSVQAIAQAFSHADGIDLDDIAKAVADFLSELVNAEIILPMEPGDSSAVAAVEQAFEMPGIEIHEDLADLMLIDPVHEVDLELGWPNKPE